MALLKNMGKLLELKDGEHYIVCWPPLPSNIKRKLEDCLENNGYKWDGGGTAYDSSECHWRFKKNKNKKTKKEYHGFIDEDDYHRHTCNSGLERLREKEKNDKGE